MTISFSGLGSGLPIDDWIKALTSSRQTTINNLNTKQHTLQTKNSTISSLSSIYNQLKSATTKITDSMMSPISDIFSQISVKTSVDSKDSPAIKATVTNLSTPSEMDIEVISLASNTKVKSNSNEGLKKSGTKLSELGVSAESILTINDANIKIKPDMTIDDLLYSIDKNPDAGVTAYLKNGSLVLESKTTGEKEISVSGEFADMLGLSDPANTSMGLNTVYKINGEQKVSSSNKLTSADTGIIGLSLELNDVTSEPISIKISRSYSTSSVESALSDFVSSFNNVITETDKQTKSGGNLYGESQLNYIRNDLRTLVSENILPAGNKYRSLADIGISTGAPGMDVSADTTKLVFDKEKFKEAFEADPEAVKALLAGISDDSGSSATKGVMQRVQDTLVPALDSISGFFKVRTDSINKEISSVTNTIDRRTRELEQYTATLTKQYNYMDQLIAKMNAQFEQMKTQLSSILNSNSK